MESQDLLRNTPPPADILDQLASYNKEELTIFINDIKKKLEEQRQLNKVLTSENVEENIQNIQNFLDDNVDDIMTQVDELSSIKDTLIKIVKENKALREEEEDLQSLVDSKECVQIANKLRDIKSIKNSIHSFLLQQGIISEE
jgi:uncharacterized Zn finger protein